jgi:CheY-like chemotaxis protein
MSDTKKQVFIFDDDEVVQQLIIKLCERKGIKAQAAATVSEINRALQKITDADLFFIDLLLPGITGWDILKLIKDNPATRNKPVIVVTGAILSPHEKEKILQQVDVVLEKKNFSVSLLENVITEWLPGN